MEGEGAGDGNLAEKSGIKIWSFDDRFYDRKFIELKWGMEIITRSFFLSNLAIAWKSPIKMEIVAGKTIELNGSFFLQQTM